MVQFEFLAQFPVDHLLVNMESIVSVVGLKWRLHQMKLVFLVQVTKGLIKGLEDLEIWGRVETIQTTALLRSARILRRVLETWVSKTTVKSSVNAGEKTRSLLLLLLLLSNSFRVFHISVSWWFFNGVWVTASLLKSPGLVSGFWPFSTNACHLGSLYPSANLQVLQAF